MDAWTIFATLITGAVFGFFGLFATVALLIRSEDQARQTKKAEDPKQPVQIVGDNPFLTQRTEK